MNACKAGEIKKIKRIPTLLAAILLLSLALPAMAAVCMWHPRTASLSGEAHNMIKFDTHPLPYMRANGTLAQYDDFLNFYGIQEGDGMYIAPEDRVAVW